MRHLPRLAILSLTLLCLVPAAQADPTAQPVARTGTCPSGYSVSGGYCAPRAGSGYAVPRPSGVACASGYRVSGDYCLAGPGARVAVPRAGTCPSGFGVSGGYCLSHR
jgi:hypothetical protein